MTNTYIRKKGVEKVKHVESVPVKETFKGKEGVELFEILGNPIKIYLMGKRA